MRDLLKSTTTINPYTYTCTIKLYTLASLHLLLVKRLRSDHTHYSYNPLSALNTDTCHHHYAIHTRSPLNTHTHTQIYSITTNGCWKSKRPPSLSWKWVWLWFGRDLIRLPHKPFYFITGLVGTWCLFLSSKWGLEVGWTGGLTQSLPALTGWQSTGWGMVWRSWDLFAGFWLV